VTGRNKRAEEKQRKAKEMQRVKETETNEKERREEEAREEKRKEADNLRIREDEGFQKLSTAIQELVKKAKEDISRELDGMLDSLGKNTAKMNDVLKESANELTAMQDHQKKIIKKVETMGETFERDLRSTALSLTNQMSDAAFGCFAVERKLQRVLTETGRNGCNASNKFVENLLKTKTLITTEAAEMQTISNSLVEDVKPILQFPAQVRGNVDHGEEIQKIEKTIEDTRNIDETIEETS
jgi:hypothetical protein